jgi:hypothetical protein
VTGDRGLVVVIGCSGVRGPGSWNAAHFSNNLTGAYPTAIGHLFLYNTTKS